MQLVHFLCISLFVYLFILKYDLFTHSLPVMIPAERDAHIFVIPEGINTPNPYFHMFFLSHESPCISHTEAAMRIYNVKFSLSTMTSFYIKINK